MLLVENMEGGKIRAKLVSELSGADDVILEEGTAGQGGKAAAQGGMRKLFDAIVSGCIPVITSDELELPFEGILDYRKCVVEVLMLKCLKLGVKMLYGCISIGRDFLFILPMKPANAERNIV
ncbi:hypothetical protein K1719_009159 [Acacia pycnantha]|nr:hypothetical protein K1719_009159 [Acacia pycnantha]